MTRIWQNLVEADGADCLGQAFGWQFSFLTGYGFVRNGVYLTSTGSSSSSLVKNNKKQPQNITEWFFFPFSDTPTGGSFSCFHCANPEDLISP
jgi:hypothetical protein